MRMESFSVDTLGASGTRYCYATAGRYTGQMSLVTQPQLCEECNQYQASKIQELNSFEPFRESNFQSELDVYKQQLEEKYRLCQSCHDIVLQHLKTQAVDLKTFLLRNHLQQSKSTPTKLLMKSSSPESVLLLLAQLSCVVLASILVCSESITDNHRNQACDGIIRLWNGPLENGGVFFSSLGTPDITSMSKKLVHHFASLVRVMSSSFCERGKEVLHCASGLTKARFLHVSLLCLLLNAVIFLKRKTRFGVFILLLWLSLSILRGCELFWWKVDSKWRFPGIMLCWCLNTSSFLFSLLFYSRALGTRKKKRSLCYSIPSPASSEKCRTCRMESEIPKADNERPSLSRRESVSSLDSNLNGLTLGIPTKGKNGYSAHLSTKTADGSGYFWSQTVSRNSKESPLVSMHQRPLIVPATLQYSGHRHQGLANVAGSLGVNSCGISSDEDSCSDLVESHTRQRLHINNKDTNPDKTKKRKWSTVPRGKQTRFVTARTFLLVSSLFLNLYLIVRFTEWPVRILQSLMKIVKR